MAKTQFTFKNYLKEVKKCRVFVIVFFVLGAIAGGIYAFSRPTEYTASSKLSFYKASVNTGSTTSPYSQVSEILMSKELIDGVNLSKYEVAEKPFGVFEITATSSDSQNAIDTANSVMDGARAAIAIAYEDAENYKITVLSRASESEQTMSTKKRILSTAIVAVGAVVLALIAVFVKFDYSSEK